MISNAHGRSCHAKDFTGTDAFQLMRWLGWHFDGCPGGPSFPPSQSFVIRETREERNFDHLLYQLWLCCHLRALGLVRFCTDAF